MPFAISPRHTSDDFQGTLTLDNKVEVFIARVEGWQLGVAKEMIQKQVPYRAFALLHMLTSYFEMIAKYHAGFVGQRRSREHFKKGVRLVFPAIEPEAEAFLNSLYDSVRNGLYHTGMTGSNVILADNLPGSVGYNSQHNMIMVSPDQLAEDLWIHFAAFAAALRDPANAELRSNCERRFDSDNALALSAQVA